LEDVIREWVAGIYHRGKHDGLVVAQWPGLELSPLEMMRIGVAKAGRLRLAPSAGLAYDFLQVVPRTIQHYGVEVNGLRYNGPVLDGYRNQPSPLGGRWAGRWPIHIGPDDVRYVYFQDPADDCWHRLEWEHAPTLVTPFSAEAAAYARQLALASGRHLDPAQALTELLGRWRQGMVTGRRERRMAVRLAADRPAIPLPAPEPKSITGPGRLHLISAAVVTGDTDDEDEVLDGVGDDFYDDAFKVLQ
jgi:hypothetical protein